MNWICRVLLAGAIRLPSLALLAGEAEKPLRAGIAARYKPLAFKEQKLDR